MIAEGSPFILSLASYPSAAAFAASMERLASDKEFQHGFEEYNSMTELSYIRMENSAAAGLRLHALDRRAARGRPSRSHLRTAHLRIQ